MKLATSPTTVKSDNITIVDSTHPLAAGRTGTQTLATKVVTFGIGTPGSSAAVVATAGGGPTIFAYTAGQPLVDASAAPACRAGLPFDFNSPASLSANGWAFVDAAMSWALGSACVP
jgi:hypothetical protein